jgi:hypothetical protein
MISKKLIEYSYSVTVPWPNERILPFETGEFATSDPNEIMRPQLEELVGIQGADWDWEVSKSGSHSIDVYFTDATEAIRFKLLWS